MTKACRGGWFALSLAHAFSSLQVDRDLRALKIDALAAAARFREEGGEESKEKVRCTHGHGAWSMDSVRGGVNGSQDYYSCCCECRCAALVVEG
jgi:hypothetical protein